MLLIFRGSASKLGQNINIRVGGEYNMIRGGARISPTAGQPSPT